MSKHLWKLPLVLWVGLMAFVVLEACDLTDYTDPKNYRIRTDGTYYVAELWYGYRWGAPLGSFGQKEYTLEVERAQRDIEMSMQMARDRLNRGRRSFGKWRSTNSIIRSKEEQ